MKDFHIKHNQHNRHPHHHGPILLHPRLPGQLFRPPLEILGSIPQIRTNIGHVFQFVPPIEDFVDILAHNALNFVQIFVEFAATRALFAEFALFALNDGVVVNELEGSGGLIDDGFPLSIKKGC